MGIKEFLQKRIERNNMIKNRQNELRVEQVAHERMESPEEREIKKWLEKQRQEELKEEVKTIRAMQTRNFFSSGILDTTNIFKNHPKILDLEAHHQLDGGLFFK
jgi:hypothetical protein